MKTLARIRSGAAALVLVAAAAALSFAATPAGSPAPSAAAKFARDVTVLASDEMEGRGLGTKGLDKAADWIEARLRALKLEPAFSGGTPRPSEGSRGGTAGAG